MRWQDILKYTTVTGTISLPVLVFLLLNLSGMQYSIPEDISCGIDCYSEIQVNSSYWNICVEHSQDKEVVYKKTSTSRNLWVNLDKIEELVTTNPQVKTELLVPTTGNKLRPVKDGDCIIKRSSNKTSKFVIHGIKKPWQTIKWGMNLDSATIEGIEFDPKWEATQVNNVLEDTRNIIERTATTDTVFLGDTTKIKSYYFGQVNFPDENGNFKPYYEITSFVYDDNLKAINISWFGNKSILLYLTANISGNQYVLKNAPVQIKNNLDLTTPNYRNGNSYYFTHNFTLNLTNLGVEYIGYKIETKNVKSCVFEDNVLTCDEQILDLNKAVSEQNIKINGNISNIFFRGNDLNFIDPTVIYNFSTINKTGAWIWANKTFGYGGTLSRVILDGVNPPGNGTFNYEFTNDICKNADDTTYCGFVPKINNRSFFLFNVSINEGASNILSLNWTWIANCGGGCGNSFNYTGWAFNYNTNAWNECFEGFFSSASADHGRDCIVDSSNKTISNFINATGVTTFLLLVEDRGDGASNVSLDFVKLQVTTGNVKKNGTLFYGELSNFTTRFRNVTNGVLPVVGIEQYLLGSLGSDPVYITAEPRKGFTETIVVAQDDASDISVYVKNGSTTTSILELTATTADPLRGEIYGVGWERLSHTGIAFYGKTTDAVLYHRTYDLATSTWSDEISDGAFSTGDGIEAIQIDVNPINDFIIVAAGGAIGTADGFGAGLWNGTSIDNTTNKTISNDIEAQGLTPGVGRSYDVCWLNGSKAIVAWVEDGSAIPAYRIFNTTDKIWAANRSTQTQNTLVEQMIIKCNPASIDGAAVLLTQDNGGDLNFQYYNATNDTWGYLQLGFEGTSNSVQWSFDIEWTNNTNQTLIVYEGGAGSDGFYRVWEESNKSFSGAYTFTTDSLTAINLRKNPYDRSEINVMTLDSGSDMNTTFWVNGGRLLSQDSGFSNEFETSASVSVNRPFDFAYTNQLNEAPIVNVIPSNLNTTLRPTSPVKLDNLNCSGTYLDANNDAGTVSLIFYNASREHFRTNLSASSNNTVVSYELTRNQTNGFIEAETWICAGRTNDGTENSAAWINSSVTIGNTAPDNPTPSITPTSPLTTDSLNASDQVSDPDADSMTVTIIWYNQSRQHFASINFTSVGNASFASYTLTNNATNVFTVGENWTAAFRVYDGTISSDWVNASVSITSSVSARIKDIIRIGKEILGGPGLIKVEEDYT